jgi:UPF0755 protein
MTIRSGGGARGGPQARPAEPGTYDDAWQPEYGPETHGGGGDGPSGRGGGGGRSGGYYGGYNGWEKRGRRGIPGIVKFLIFALVLAAIVLVTLVTVLRPLVRDAVLGWATDNPAALGMPFIADLVKEDLGDRLTKPASTDTTQVPFTVDSGETASAIASRLQEDGFLADGRAFVFIAMQRGLTGDLQKGSFILRRSMTPDQIVTALLAPEQVKTIQISLRTGLRLEQITAKLETVEGLQMHPADFYQLAKHPTAKLVADYPWLKEILPTGASLEGFLWPATYDVLPDTSAEELIRKMLDGFHAAIGDRLNVPAARGRSFYQILTLGSMVEREAAVDPERKTIAGVFENRLHKLNGVAPVLASDPTVIYAVDTLALADLDPAAWKTYNFWKVPAQAMGKIQLSTELLGYQTYTQADLPPSPICTPTLASIDAALAPDTKSGYLFFVRIPDTNTHAFAKTAADHAKNLKKYGYG